MTFDHLKKRHDQVRNRDQIYQSESIEKSIVSQTNQLIVSAGFVADAAKNNQNYGIPNSYHRGSQRLAYRFVDSLFFNNPEIQQWTNDDIIITDNVPLVPVNCQQISVLPEFWHIFHNNPDFVDREPTSGYNCFMHRISGDRSQIFYELVKRDILTQGLVSFNCWRPGDGRHQIDHDYTQVNYDWQYEQAEMFDYATEHQQGRQLIPYCSINESQGLVQNIIDSRISLIAETYISDSHIVFSEKLFRALQLPRPWLLYCSPGSIELLQAHGFDVLDDVVDVAYNKITEHSARLLNILDQLETFINRKYSVTEYKRFQQAAAHNQQLLLNFGQQWPDKFNCILEKIQQL
jgi:hypothetical protein